MIVVFVVFLIVVAVIGISMVLDIFKTVMGLVSLCLLFLLISLLFNPVETTHAMVDTIKQMQSLAHQLY